MSLIGLIKKQVFDTCSVAFDDVKTHEAWRASVVANAQDSHVKCDVCGLGCRNEQVLAVHKYDHHGIKRSMRHFVDGPSCACCMQFFGARELVLSHLHDKSIRCYTFYQSFDRLDEDAVARLDDLDRLRNADLRKQGWKPTKTVAPATRLHGPLTARAYELGVSFKSGLQCHLPACFKR